MAYGNTTSCALSTFRDDCRSFERCYPPIGDPTSSELTCDCDSFYGRGGVDCAHWTLSSYPIFACLFVLPIQVWWTVIYKSSMLLRDVTNIPEGFNLNVVGVALLGTLGSGIGGVGMVLCNGLAMFCPWIDEGEVIPYVLWNLFSLLLTVTAPLTMFVVSLAWIGIVEDTIRRHGHQRLVGLDYVKYGTAVMIFVTFTTMAYYLLNGYYYVAGYVSIGVSVICNVAYFVGARKLAPLQERVRVTRGGEESTFGTPPVASARAEAEPTPLQMIRLICDKVNATTVLYIGGCLVYTYYCTQNEKRKFFHISPIANGAWMGGFGLMFRWMLEYLTFSYKKVLKRLPKQGSTVPPLGSGNRMALGGGGTNRTVIDDFGRTGGKGGGVTPLYSVFDQDDSIVEQQLAAELGVGKHIAKSYLHSPKIPK